MDFFNPTSTISGDFYTNIPQNNVSDIFKEKNKKTTTNENYNCN
jgi:hypothetical protein